MSPSTESFWARLVEAMTDKGIPSTQTNAGKLAGVTQPAARKWAEGGFPEMNKAKQIAKILGVSVDWLLTGEGPKRVPNVNESDEELIEFLAMWPDLPAEGRRVLIESAKLMRPKVAGDAA